MIAALAYGGFELFVASPEKGGGQEKSGPDIESARQMAQNIETRLKQTELSTLQNEILDLSARPWEKDPFHRLPQEEKITETKDSKQKAKQINLEYTGYLEIGSMKMAIINGVEYRTGQKLEQGTAVVQSISPDRVIIKSAKNGKKISVPYKE
ncbi:MAG: hypothetical protein KGY38_07730, partial [Desulfobacterales bacterium]|nr:hypothetical protein [Desulfobacterales bacterium]